ncbi:hypothetical protein [Microvirga sp. CF3016]|uniref:hypothetical protein n=1 Tax=Microvirga sp. CF3016 TaxID=3110181 RepID=UPI002E79CC8C|nr:hypothetical protein [Microvirga sp. CF3016]MEE1610606.1 hypothetical protein [Microvirga sp. CF3016]
MIVLLYRLASFLLLSIAMATTAVANEDEIWSENITSTWLDDHVAAKRSVLPRPSPRLSRTQVWANGIARTDMQAFLPTDFDRAVGAKMQPFQDYNFLIGTELIRSGGEASGLSSKASWEAFLKRDWERLGVTVGLSTAGFLDSMQNGYSQTLSGTLDIPFDFSLQAWSTELRLSPSMNLDGLSGDISSGLLSEIVGRIRLTSPADRFRSDLNVRLGYGIAPRTRPVASATLELRIAPNL